MTLRDSLLRTADKVRNIRLTLDQEPHGVTIRTRTWAGGAIDADPPVTLPATPPFADVDLVLPRKHPVRQLTTREISNSGGAYEIGDMMVDHITPTYHSTFGSGGFTVAQLDPKAQKNGVEVYAILTDGQHQGEYAVKEVRSARAYTIQLVLGRRLTTPSIT
jgi:hypothetical protein